MQKQPDIQTLLRWYEQMVTIRQFEECAINCYRKGMFTGSTHPCIAQEAIAVGAAAALEPTDQVLATYRGHGHAIAKGLDVKSIMAELFSKASGCSGGRGGSMHLIDVEKGLLGTNAIVAAQIPIAGGVALANKLKKNRRVTVVFFGDGATCEGAFFETLNMATLWKVPLVFVCENNGFAISVRTENAIPLEKHRPARGRVRPAGRDGGRQRSVGCTRRGGRSGGPRPARRRADVGRVQDGSLGTPQRDLRGQVRERRGSVKVEEARPHPAL